MDWKKVVLVVTLVTLAAASVLVAAAGCGGSGKPAVVVFLGKSSKSYADTKAMVDEAKKKFGDKVVFEEFDYDSPSSKGAIAKYSVSMNPTIIIKNAQGAIKQTYMGKPMKDELLMTIESFIPGKKTSAPSGAPGSMPGITTTPAAPFPPGANPAPSSTPPTIP